MGVSLATRSNLSRTEWDLRVQLAAAYRIADPLGWSELIYTHISARIPGRDHHFLINPYGLRFDEVTASSLVKIDVDGNPVEPQQHKANKAGFIIHSAIHSARADAGCVWHMRSEEHTSELQSPCNLVCRLLLEKKKKNHRTVTSRARTSSPK